MSFGPRKKALAAPLLIFLALCGTAAASPSYGGGYAGVRDATQPPYRAVGKLFVAFSPHEDVEPTCSATAIDTPSRQLLLTAGHCVRDQECEPCLPRRAQRIKFVPAYDGERSPFGVFWARSWRVPPRWRSEWPGHAHDVAVVRVRPNGRGEDVADAVGGGIEVAYDQPRDQRYLLLGYPGLQPQMHRCEAKYSGDDPLYRTHYGPPPFRVGCFMGPGASGGPFLIEGGTKIAGVNSYGRPESTKSTFSPYLSKRLVAPLLAKYYQRP